MTPPINIDGTSITGASIDGQDVSAITVDGTQVFSTVPDRVNSQDLVAWYRFEDGDARDYTNDLNATFADSTAFDGTVNGATFQTNGGVIDFESGANSGAFDFDGTDDNISVPDYGLFGGGQSVTVLAWVNQDQLTGDRGHVFSSESESTFVLRNRSNTNEFSIDFSAGRVTLTGGPPPFGNWQHWACVYDASNGMEYYLDANLQGSDGTTGSINSFGASSNHIGAQLTDGRFLDGRIDDVRIYNAALTGAEISEIYNATEPGP